MTEPHRTGRAAARALIAVLALPLGGISSFEALFAPKSELWPRWQAHDAGSDVQIDHGVWDRLLEGYVARDAGGINRFDYGAVSAADRAALDGYLAALAVQPISRFDRAEQRAYWINLYNALTVDVVLDHYPVDSIRDIDISRDSSPTAPGAGRWSPSRAKRSPSTTSSTASCGLSGATRGSTTRSTAPRSAAPTCGPRPSPPPTARRCWSPPPATTWARRAASR